MAGAFEKLTFMGQEDNRKRIPYGRQWVFAEDIDAVQEVLRSDWLTQGPVIEEFENALAAHCGARYAVAVSNGTAALHAACFAAGVESGREVITSPISFVASANAVLYQNGRPVFADILEDTLTLDPEAVEQAVTTRTRAIIAVDFAGHPAELDELRTIAEKHDLLLIEDAAHALGARYKGRTVGNIADMTVFSFHPVKHITTGEGGMVLTDDARLCERLRLFRTHGITRRRQDFTDEDDGPWYYEMQELGFNYRITDFQCALGLSQLARLDGFVARRREIAETYRIAFDDLADITCPTERPYCESSFHIYPVRVRTSGSGRARKQVFNGLIEAGLNVNVHYIPIHLQPYYRKRFGTGPGLFPRAERYYERAITLPIFPRMKDDDVDRVIEAVHQACG